ncbi:MAG: septum formation family protein [Mycobacterium sp.]
MVATIMTSPQEPDPGPGPYQLPYPYLNPAGHPPPGPGSAPAGYTPTPYPYPPRRSTSGWAIAAFVLGLLSCVPLGVIFGIIALVKTKDGRQYGRGLAIAWMVISGLWVVVGVIAALVALNGNTLVAGTVHSSPLLTVGECFNDDINYPVSCDQPHSDEAFAVLSLSRWPGRDGDHDELMNRCRAELQKYSPSASRDPNVQIVIEGPGTDWKYMGNHTSGCLAHFTANRVGSIKG